MSDLSRYAIFALLDSNSASIIRNEQHRLSSITANKMAFCFPVHITLKGRFIAKESKLNKLANFKLTNINTPFDISLSQSLYINPELVWLELLPYAQGYETIVNLHKLFEDIVKPDVIEDEVPESHKNNYFRPHVTLGWGLTPQFWEKYSLQELLRFYECKIDNIVLVCYPNNWLQGSPIKVISKIPIGRDI